MKSHKVITLPIITVLLFTLIGPARGQQNKFDAAMNPILDQYLKITEVLATDKTDGVTAAAGKITTLSGALDPAAAKPEHAAHYRNLPADLKKSAEKVAAAKTIDEMRDRLVELSKPMAMWATMALPTGINVVFCSMKPGSWLQRGATVRNPYYGASMSSCGEIVAGEAAPAAKKGGAPADGHRHH